LDNPHQTLNRLADERGGGVLSHSLFVINNCHNPAEFLGVPPYDQEDIRIMHPVSGSYDAPVFIFNGEAVPVETESFGPVKTLYR